MSDAPKTFIVALPPSHIFAKMSIEEFEGWFGVHAQRVILKPIPATIEQPSCTADAS